MQIVEKPLPETQSLDKSLKEPVSNYNTSQMTEYIENNEKMDVDTSFNKDIDKKSDDDILSSQSKQNTETVSLFATQPTSIQSSICFHSKKNPEKQIQLIEVSSHQPVVSSQAPQQVVEVMPEMKNNEDQTSANLDQNNTFVENDKITTPKRRSMRLR